MVLPILLGLLSRANEMVREEWFSAVCRPMVTVRATDRVQLTVRVSCRGTLSL